MGLFDFALSGDEQSNQTAPRRDGNGRVEPELGNEGASQSSEFEANSVFTAVQDQRGLRLVSGRGPVEVLVIDQAEQPTGN